MTQTPSDGVEPGGEAIDGWPVQLSGVTETVVATEGPNGRWNQAALGVRPAADGSDVVDRGTDEPVTAHSYGRTRTRQNFDAGRPAYAQFTTDPLDFVEAALGVYETGEPILSSADAWTRIEVEKRGRTNEHGTEIVEWSLRPVSSGIRERSVPTLHRGRAAVVEATVPASRLDVEGYDEEQLLERLESLADVVETAGDDRAKAAFARIDDLVGWRERLA